MERWLYPALKILAADCANSVVDLDVGIIGRSWLALSRFFIDLYFPDRPVDPAEKQHFVTAYYQEEINALVALLDMQVTFEQKRTGNRRNSCVDLLQSKVEALQDQTPKSPMPAQAMRRDPNRLRGLWSEASQFLSQVVSPSRVGSLVDLLQVGGAAAVLQEEVVQKSISGFRRRMDSTYTDYTDIWFPLHLALLHMQLGLSLIAQQTLKEGAQAVSIPFAQACVGFPTVSAVVNLRSKTEIVPLFLDLIFRLSALGFRSKVIQDVKPYLPFVETIYDQAVRLWLIDQTKAGEEESERQNLYRRKRFDHDPLTDAEIEEAEFKALFPTFENVDDETSPEVAPSTSQSRHVTEVHAHQLLRSHYTMFGNWSSPTGERLAAHTHFQEMQMTLTRLLTDSKTIYLPDTLDEDSKVVQMARLQQRLRSVRNYGTENSHFNFYLDPNVPEIRKAAGVVQRLVARLDNLIVEWPDQMVLQHIRSRCIAFLALSLHSPVAKVLSFLEHLLNNTEDWEMYSNKDNTLKLHRREMTDLIVEWRRLELSCWQRLLEDQADAFISEVTPWWFRLYDLLVRGPSSLATRTEKETNAYLEDIIPLLDEFITASPMGQYQERIRLLSSFRTHTGFLVEIHTGSLRHILRRVTTILHTKCMFFSQFSAGISTSIASQRSTLEGEIRSFIKLASWKDVNVQALKQSAQRTHRQLYKITRKFREVLRQPVTLSLNVPRSSGITNGNSTGAWGHGLEYSAVFASTTNLITLAPSEKRYIANLQQTLFRLDSYFINRILPNIRVWDARAVHELSSAIADTSESLANESIPDDLPPVRKNQLQKALLVRKRKAWSDLLKELRRIGLASNIKPEVLALQRTSQWLNEQPVLLMVTELSTPFQSNEGQLLRLLSLLPEVRNAPSHHHDDLTTREIQRGLLFVESALGLSLQARAVYVIHM
jgi:midasin